MITNKVSFKTIQSSPSQNRLVFNGSKDNIQSERNDLIKKSTVVGAGFIGVVGFMSHQNESFMTRILGGGVGAGVGALIGLGVAALITFVKNYGFKESTES